MTEIEIITWLCGGLFCLSVAGCIWWCGEPSVGDTQNKEPKT